MKLTNKDKAKKKYSKPKIYKIDPNDPRVADLKKLFDQLKKKPTPQKSDPQDLSAEVKRSSRSQASGIPGRKTYPTPR
jgi:hypothetical protein